MTLNRSEKMTTATRRTPLARRIGRHILIAGSAMSLVLSVSVLLLLIRQHFATDEWRWVRDAPSLNSASVRLDRSWRFISEGRTVVLRLVVCKFDLASEGQLDSDGITLSREPVGIKHYGAPSTPISPLLSAVPLASHYDPYIPLSLAKYGVFAGRTSGYTDTVTDDIVGVPTWSLVVAFGVLPVAWPVTSRLRITHRRRAAQGLCPACGCDVRATPGRCPECGVEATAGRA